MFAEFSPLIRIKRTDEFLKNSLSLLKALPGNKIKLIELVIYGGGGEGRSLLGKREILKRDLQKALAGWCITSYEYGLYH